MRYNNILVVGIVLILGNTSMSIQIMVDLGQRYPEVTERTPLRSNGNPYQESPRCILKENQMAESGRQGSCAESESN